MSNLYYENLSDRRLWIDGSNSYNVGQLVNKILSGEPLDGLAVDDLNDVDIKKFLRISDINLDEKKSPDFSRLNDNFILSERYKNISLEEFFIKRLKREVASKPFSLDEKAVRTNRVFQELEIYTEKNMLDILRLAIYIVDSLTNNKIIWGPGRGSSCCSYLLYLIGLHDIDSVEYELEIFEFLRDD